MIQVLSEASSVQGRLENAPKVKLLQSLSNRRQLIRLMQGIIRLFSGKLICIQETQTPKSSIA